MQEQALSPDFIALFGGENYSRLIFPSVRQRTENKTVPSDPIAGAWFQANDFPELNREAKPGIRPKTFQRMRLAMIPVRLPDTDT